MYGAGLGELAHPQRRPHMHLRVVGDAAAVELGAVGGVQRLEVGGLSGRPLGPQAGARPRRTRRDERLAQVGERGGEREREVRSVGDRAEVGKAAAGMFGDKAPQEALAGETRELYRRRAARLRGQPSRELPQREHRHVGDRPQSAHEDVADARAHGEGADHDRQRRQRPPSPQLADALHERRLELREAAAHEHPALLIGPGSHAGGERITGP